MFFEVLTAVCAIVTCVIEVAQVVFTALKDLGIIDTNATSADDLGAKILTAEENGVSRSDFEDFNDWKDYINNIEVEDSSKFSADDKAKKAIEYETECIRNYLGRDLSPTAYGSLLENINYFKDNNRLEYLSKNDSDIDRTIIDIGDFFENRTVGFEADNIKDKLIDLEMAMNPDISRTEAFDNIYSYKK